MKHAPRALTKPHKRDEMPVREGVELFVFGGTRDTHSFNDGNSSAVVEGWETVAADPCCRVNRRDPHEVQNARNAESENRKPVNKLAKI